MIAVIMAGGMGTRLKSVSGELPKPMTPICGKPVLLHQIERLKANNILEIVLVIGYLGESIQSYFQDGSAWGVNISYIIEKEPLGTAGGLYYLKDKLTEPFLLINGDLIFDIDFKRMREQFHGVATLLVHPNSHPHDSRLCKVDQNGMVVAWGVRGEGRNLVNAGVHLLSPEIFEVLNGGYADLDKDIIGPLVSKQLIFTYRSPEYVRDLGTPSRFSQVEKDLVQGIVEKRNLTLPQKAIFLDRDGTINEHIGFISSPEQFILTSNAGEAIAKINQSGYLAIVVTNQPVIARGECSLEELDKIHEMMDALLGEHGAYIDDLFFCPHHPHKGFKGERPEYKIECECRKPSPGLLLKAAAQYHIDLESSWIVGDGLTDIQAGKVAGCKTAYVGKERLRADIVTESLFTAVEQIIEVAPY